MSKNPILVVGSSNTDMIIKVGHIPKPGETILGGEFAMAAGGKGANQAVGAARAGGTVTLIARVGRDMFGDKAVAGFVADGINVDYIVRDKTSPSGVALIFVAGNGENSIAVASGANAKLTPADLATAGARVILNPAPARPLPDELLRRVYLLTPNESEAEMLTGLPVNNESAAAKAADALLARGVQNVIITLGARGAFVAGRQERGLVKGYKVKPVDTTGAGDVFNGTLAVALAEGKSLLDAARFASAAAAISVTRLGAQTSAPKRNEIEQLLTADGHQR
jgi:ribokinase